MPRDYDAILLVSFGGPEAPEDVLPFMENVTRGRNIPRERLEEVSQHYFEFGGRSPINDQNRALIAALEPLLEAEGPHLPVYFGNRNWDPLLRDTLARMRDDGVQRALCFVTAAYSSYSGCRQYREDLAAARAQVPNAPELDKLRVFYNHPGFIEPQVDLVAEALATLPADEQDDAALVFTTHSIPLTMARHSDYEVQHLEACRLVVELLRDRLPRADGQPRPWELVYCSRSGPPHIPWLEPDVSDHLATLQARGARAAVCVPIGFISDHMEVIYDLDVEARQAAGELGLSFARAGTVGTDPRFVAMIRALVLERTEDAARSCLGSRGPSHDACPVDCCLTPGQPTREVVAAAEPPRR